MNDNNRKVGADGMGSATTAFTYITSEEGTVRPEEKGTVPGVTEETPVVVLACGTFGSRTVQPALADAIRRQQATRPQRECDKKTNKDFDAQSAQMGLPLVTPEGQGDQAGPEF